MKNMEEGLYLCNKHNGSIAESRCKECNEYLCVDCSIEHNAMHKVVILRQEAMQFARSVINKTFTPMEEESCSKAALDKLTELTQSHDELQRTVKQAKQKLVHFGDELGNEIEELNGRANTISKDLDHLKDTNCNRLCEEIKGFMNQRDYFSVYKKKEEFAHIVANRNALNNSRIDQMLKQMRKYKKSINKLLGSLSSRQEEIEEGAFENVETHRIVGRLEGSILLYDLISKRKQIVKPKNVKLHECCEGIEARGSIYITGGKDDDKDTYEFPIDDYKGELIVRAEMVQGRCNHTLCQMKDAEIYCAGGVYDKTTISKCERYDIIKDEWEEICSLNEAKHNGSMCTLADRYIFFIGGGKIGHSSLVSTIEVLDTKTELGWEILAFDPGKSKWLACECVNCISISRNEIMIFGGWEKDKDSRSSCFVYNYSSNTMTKAQYKMKKNSAFFYRVTPIIYDGKIFSMSPDENIHTFSLKDQSWDILEASDWKDQVSLNPNKALLLTGRILHTLCVYEMTQGYGHSFNPRNFKFVECSEGVIVGDTVFIIGGENDSKATVALNVKNYKREIERKADLNIGRYNHAVEEVCNEYIYCCGGCAGREMLSHCEKYIIQKNKWFAAPRLREAKQNITLCSCNNVSLFCFGGGLIGHENLFSTVEKLDLHDEEGGWIIVNIGHNQQWKPLECVGSAQINPFEILLFGGWKPNRDESSKCFTFNVVQNEIVKQQRKLTQKTGFYYSLKPRSDLKKIYAMDPGFNVNIYDIFNKSWKLLRKEEWKEDDKKEDDRCTVV